MKKSFFFLSPFIFFWVFFFLFFLHIAFSVNAQTAVSSTYGERIFYYSTLKSTVADFAAHASDIDIIAPQTYEITASLTASGTVSNDLVNMAKENGVKIMPLIANRGFNRTIAHDLLASNTAQDTLAAFLVSEAQVKGYCGWQLDLEHIPSTDKSALSAFVAKVAEALHARGLILSIAVVAQTPNSPSTDPSSSFYQKWSGAYDYRSLGSSTDFTSLMAYDDPDSNGASAPLSFVRSAIENAQNQIPPSKISLGIPLYYWGWTTSNPPIRINSGGTYQSAMDKMAKYSALQGFNQSVGTPWIIYKLNKKIYMIWYENARSFSLKASLIGTYHLRGFSAWVLGDEDPEIWSMLEH